MLSFLSSAAQVDCALHVRGKHRPEDRPLQGERVGRDGDATKCARGDVLARNTGLEGGDHAGDGVAEGGAAVEVGLPETLEDVEVVFPAALVEAFAEGIGDVAGGGSAAGVFAGTGG